MVRLILQLRASDLLILRSLMCTNIQLILSNSPESPRFLHLFCQISNSRLGLSSSSLSNRIYMQGSCCQSHCPASICQPVWKGDESGCGTCWVSSFKGTGSRGRSCRGGCSCYGTWRSCGITITSLTKGEHNLGTMKSQAFPQIHDAQHGIGDRYAWQIGHDVGCHRLKPQAICQVVSSNRTKIFIFWSQGMFPRKAKASRAALSCSAN